MRKQAGRGAAARRRPAPRSCHMAGAPSPVDAPLRGAAIPMGGCHWCCHALLHRLRQPQRYRRCAAPPAPCCYCSCTRMAYSECRLRHGCHRLLCLQLLPAIVHACCAAALPAAANTLRAAHLPPPAETPQHTLLPCPPPLLRVSHRCCMPPNKPQQPDSAQLALLCYLLCGCSAPAHRIGLLAGGGLLLGLAQLLDQRQSLALQAALEAAAGETAGAMAVKRSTSEGQRSWRAAAGPAKACEPGGCMVPLARATAAGEQVGRPWLQLDVQQQLQLPQLQCCWAALKRHCCSWCAASC